MKRMILCFLAIAIITIAFISVSHAQPESNSRIDKYKTDLLEFQAETIQMVESWDRESSILCILSIVVIALGALTAFIQKVKIRYYTIITAMMALLISIFTAVDTTIYSEDHKTLDKKVRIADKMLFEVKCMFSDDVASDPESVRRENLDNIKKTLIKIAEIDVQAPKNVSVFPEIDFVSKAYAESMEREPEWVRDPPSGEKDIYFVGFAESRSLTKAKEISFQSAIENGVEYLSAEFWNKQQTETSDLDYEGLSNYLFKSAIIVDTYLNRDDYTRNYQYYSLVKLNRSIANLDLSSYAIEKRIDIPQSIDKVVQVSNPDKSDYFLKMSELYKTKINHTQEILSPENYEKFNDGRLLRKKGQNEQAIGIFKEVIEENPDDYFIWYNLALAYSKVGDTDNANNAFLTAIELDKTNTQRDASLYNTYGYFLYNKGQFDEAIPQLEEALEIEPEHPKAKRNLKAAIYMRDQ